MCRIIFVLLLSVLSSGIFSQVKVQAFQWKGRVIDKKTTEAIPSAYFKIFSNGRIFLFAAANNGFVALSYINPSENDSIQVTCIGYKPLTGSLNKILRVDKPIILDPEDILLQEVVVHGRKVKTAKIGNLNTWTYFSMGSAFGDRMALFIPVSSKAKILKLRYYMGGIIKTTSYYYPFLVRIYEKDTVNNTVGRDIFGKNLIVRREKGHGPWVEVDVSEYNIEMPAGGVFVGLEVLPKEYYLSNQIIESATIKVGRMQVINSVSIGATRVRPSRLGPAIESWSYNSAVYGWHKNSRGYNYLINIVIEPILPQ